MGIWLAVCALLVLAMIVVGGITRVTRSGLSITTWDPVTGALPPIGEQAWRDAFARYQASPEGRLVNAGMSLPQFQSIYFVEWAHRLLGRLVGLVVAVPLVVFLARRRGRSAGTWSRAGWSTNRTSARSGWRRTCCSA